MESLLVWTVERVGEFPREHKFTAGDRLVESRRTWCGPMVRPEVDPGARRPDERGLDRA